MPNTTMSNPSESHSADESLASKAATPNRNVNRDELERPHETDIVYPSAIPFILAHLVCFAAIWTGVSAWSLWLCFALYVIRMWGVTGGYHRYFSHRSYKTSRVGQFIIALIAQSSAQRGVLWWASKHRSHHKYSDTPLDVHSPGHRGFWFAHMGWIFDRNDGDADLSNVSDISRYPELRFLDRWQYAPAIALGTVVWLVGGWEALVVGFFWSTVLLYHGTFAINSLAHVVGNKRFITGDDSRNNWWLALITLGEGWHNNHHHYHTSTRQGFYWWEIDITFYVLKVMSWTRFVWDLRSPPKHILEGPQELGHGLVDRVARQLAESFPLERITEQVSEKLDAATAEIGKMKRPELLQHLQEIHLPQVPSLEELRARAHEWWTETPSIEQIVERAREYIYEEIAQRLGPSGVVPA